MWIGQKRTVGGEKEREGEREKPVEGKEGVEREKEREKKKWKRSGSVKVERERKEGTCFFMPSQSRRLYLGESEGDRRGGGVTEREGGRRKEGERAL